MIKKFLSIFKIQKKRIGIYYMTIQFSGSDVQHDVELEVEEVEIVGKFSRIKVKEFRKGPQKFKNSIFDRVPSLIETQKIEWL